MKEFSKNKKLIISYVIPIILVILVGIYYLKEVGYVGTDNAYIKAGKIYISSEVNGKVVKIEVKENERVEKGRILITIDDEPYHIALNQAKANLDSIVNGIEVLKAQYLENTESLKLAVMNKDYAQREFYRASELAKKRAGTEAQVDAAANKLNGTKQQIAILEQERRQLIINLSGDPLILVEKHPKYIEAKASVEHAELNLKRTVLRAPNNGIVSQVSTLSVGDYVATGSSLFSIVLLDDIWVEANLKETDLTNVKAGQKVKVMIDTFPNLKVEGAVESVGAASGAEFSILPPQNATGNWVKIVQRIPVRISIEQPDSTLPLRAGMSAVIQINTKSSAE
ncbi:HlyD family secretion protein [Holosporaceae bacterium 'Namur']|nr:HlyD family secretion protein [Holosporaceae bacterium 'Namur']